MMNGAAIRKWIWLGAGIGAALWTLLTWGAYALLGVTSEALSGGVGFLAAWPEVEYWLAWSVRLAEQFGVVVLVALWAIGLLLLALAAWLGARIGTRLLMATGFADSHGRHP